MSVTDYSIYEIVFPNGKIYIGQSCTVSKRWYEHKRVANKGSTSYPVYRALRKYGIENVEFRILFSGLDRAGADLAEKRLIEERRSFLDEFGYNITKGGQGDTGYHGAEGQENPMSFTKISERIGCSIEEAYKHTPNYGRSPSEYARKRASETHKGKVLTPETKARMLEASLSKRQYTLTNDVTGEIVETNDLFQWCKDHNLSYNVLVVRSRGQEQRSRRKHKEWSIKRIDLRSDL